VSVKENKGSTSTSKLSVSPFTKRPKGNIKLEQKSEGPLKDLFPTSNNTSSIFTRTSNRRKRTIDELKDHDILAGINQHRENLRNTRTRSLLDRTDKNANTTTAPRKPSPALPIKTQKVPILKEKDKKKSLPPRLTKSVSVLRTVWKLPPRQVGSDEHRPEINTDQQGNIQDDEDIGETFTI
jgi:hypothetical protein